MTTEGALEYIMRKANLALVKEWDDLNIDLIKNGTTISYSG